MYQHLILYIHTVYTQNIERKKSAKYIWTTPDRRREALQLRRDLSLALCSWRNAAQRLPLSSDLVGLHGCLELSGNSSHQCIADGIEYVLLKELKRI